MRFDVVVLGAGPAGAVVARRLAQAGARVALLGGQSRRGVEGLSERSRALLIEEGVEAARIAGPFPRLGRWGERPVDGREWLVRREEVAAALRAHAGSAGATLLKGWATRTERPDINWNVDSNTDARSLDAPVLIDARGRRGREARGPLLMAVGLEYRLASRVEGGTRIEPMDEGWCWWAQGGNSLWVQIVGNPRARPPGEWIGSAAGQIPALRRALEGAAPWGEMNACAAHGRQGMCGGGPGLWRAGDAAAALDPLSGQGIYHAIASARMVASAVDAVARGKAESSTQRLVANRQARTFRRGLEIAAQFYGENAARGRFWTETAAVYRAAAAGPGEDEVN